MAWTVPEADVYMVCLLKRREGKAEKAREAEKAGLQWVSDLVASIREHHGMIQLLSLKPEMWEVWEGKDHQVEPDHLHPAIFDFNSIVVAAFPDDEMVSGWWDSDMVFELMKNRQPIESIGLFTVDGLVKAVDVTDPTRLAFGAKYVLFEFHKMLSFKPVQQYCDNHRRYCEATRVKAMVSDSVKGTFVNDYPLDAVCATTWKQLLEAKLWRFSDIYQMTMVPLREHSSLCLTLLVPMHEASLAELEKARKVFALKDTMSMMTKKEAAPTRKP